MNVYLGIIYWAFTNLCLELYMHNLLQPFGGGNIFQI